MSLQSFFSFDPTDDQQVAIDKLERFFKKPPGKDLFVLKGYAGTGKTTLISAFIDYVAQENVRTILLAPTGRAAKVLGSYSKNRASTIHRGIYFFTSVGGVLRFKLQQNKLKNAIFIVDETSMISNGGGMGASFAEPGKTLLDDLFQFVYSGTGCKLVFIGDTAQLPPVLSDFSPALSVTHLSSNYTLNIDAIELKQVTRQAKDAQILVNATFIRNKIERDDWSLPLFNSIQQDVEVLPSIDIPEKISSCYSMDGVTSTIVLCRSNKQANGMNRFIRFNVLFHEEELSAGELLMVVKNNYFWLADQEKADFIANGDIIKVNKIVSMEDKFGFRFADISVELESGLEVEVKVILDCLHIDGPAFDRSKNNELYEAVFQEYSYLVDKKKIREAVKIDPYFNALQIKYSYAITCHKSQGGQWKNVFLDQGFLTEDMIDKSYLRWLYTAVTRAEEKLYLLNFHPSILGESEVD